MSESRAGGQRSERLRRMDAGGVDTSPGRGKKMIEILSGPEFSPRTRHRAGANTQQRHGGHGRANRIRARTGPTSGLLESWRWRHPETPRANLSSEFAETGMSSTASAFPIVVIAFASIREARAVRACQKRESRAEPKKLLKPNLSENPNLRVEVDSESGKSSRFFAYLHHIDVFEIRSACQIRRGRAFRQPEIRIFDRPFLCLWQNCYTAESRSPVRNLPA